ncbi:MAG: metal-dependent hydrolase [Patescibacteria group bacterium]
MLLAHSIVGIMPVSNSEFSWFWFIGSVIADIDHLFVLYAHKIFSWDKFIDAVKYEDKYGIHFKTKYMHSIFGAVVTSIPLFFISAEGALYYFAAYLIHLVLDWPDIDEKQYFFPFKKKVRGFLPIFSRIEIVFTVLLLGILASIMV